MDRTRQIEDLADELLDEILTFLVGPDLLRQDTQLTSMPDGQAERNGYGERRDLDKFRLVNRRFMRIGTPRKFCRFVLRFSSEGFQRLEEFLDMRLACYVRHFTYMVRPFYQRSGWLQVLDETDRDDLPVSTLRKRLDDQDELIDTGRELALLRRALAAFSSLQQVKLLRLQDGADELLLRYPSTPSTPSSSSSSRSSSRFRWRPACTRALANLSRSLVDSPCSAIRFVGPHISADTSTLRMLQTQPSLGPRLSGLSIHLSTTLGEDQDQDQDRLLLPLWQTTTNTLTSLHLGFDPRLALRLAQILPCTIHLRRLHTLSLHNCTLDGAPLVSFLHRHPALRHVRLRGVWLHRSGSGSGSGRRWVDILSVLRGLRLVSLELRGVDYTSSDEEPRVRDDDGSSYENKVTCPSPSPSVNLEDDGIKVTPAQERIWEAWVLSGHGS